MLADLVAPTARRLLLAHFRRQDPAALLLKSRALAQRAVIAAARHSQAYRTLLHETGIDATKVSATCTSAFEALPRLTKASTFGRFPLTALMRATAVGQIADVLTSSGRGSQGFGFRLTSRAVHDRAWFGIDLGLENMFGVDRKSTLVVNCLPMGVTFSSRAVAVANVSVRQDMACAILRDVGGRFDQVIVCTDPMFVNQLLDEGARQGVDWSALNVSLVMGEEMLVEAQRRYLEAKLGIVSGAAEGRVVASSFGVGELGLNLLFETRETIRMRRMQSQRDADRHVLDTGRGMGTEHPALFCFDPLRCHVEVIDPDANGFGELCFTMLGGRELIPLPRYLTGDVGRLVGPNELRQLAAGAGLPGPPWLPVLAVRGRAKDRPSDLGLPSVEAVKELIYADHGLADHFTGAFKLQVGPEGTVRLRLRVRSTQAAAEGDIEKRLSTKAQTMGFGPMRFELCGAEWGADPDYERKYEYLAADR